MGRIYNNIVETVGRTPLVRLNKVTDGAAATILQRAAGDHDGSGRLDRAASSREQQCAGGRIYRFYFPSVQYA